MNKKSIRHLKTPYLINTYLRKMPTFNVRYKIIVIYSFIEQILSARFVTDIFLCTDICNKESRQSQYLKSSVGVPMQALLFSNSRRKSNITRHIF